jgi:pimeloyl-ACP methyl ester carboxylesterase
MAPRTPLPLLFISGAGLPAWIWDDVRARLGTETRVAERPIEGDATLAEYVDAALASAEGWGRFMVVAHSAGGVIASGLVARESPRVAGVLGIAASFPEPGTSYLDALPFGPRHLTSAVMRIAGTRPPTRQIEKVLCRGLEAALAHRIAAEFRPEAQHLYRDPVPNAAMPAERLYVVTTSDPTSATSAQRYHAARLGGRIEELPTGHLPMLEAPAALAKLITTLMAES